MPNRIIREGINSSHRVNALQWNEEVFYRRLHSVVDDYGRYEADPMLLKSRCFPLRETVRTADIAHWLAACEKAGLLLQYTAQGKRYIQILDFRQQVRSKSKFPDPPSDAAQMRSKCEATAHLGVCVSESVVVSVSGPSDDDEKVEELYRLYPRKVGARKAKQAIAKALKTAPFETILAGVKRYAAERRNEDPQFTKHPQTWFNGAHWEDEPAKKPGGFTIEKDGTDPDIARTLKEMAEHPDDDPYEDIPEEMA